MAKELTEKDSAGAGKRHQKSYKYKMILKGALIGLITGALISVFRLMLMGADSLRGRLVAYANSGAGPAVIAALILIAIAAVVTVLLVIEPDIAGSGIPQVEGELRGQKDMCWWKVIAGKMAGCALAIGGGLALGREGPSIQIGAMVGKGFARAGRVPLTEERLLLTCGAGAGLSAAFGAPLAGAIFSLEELHRNFSAEVLLTTMAAAAASDFVAANILGLTPVFGFDVEHGLPLKYYWAVILLGVILGAFGAVYNKTIAFMQDFYGKLNPKWLKAVVPFIWVLVLAFLWPDMLGSGHHLVGETAAGHFELKVLALILVTKFLFSGFSFGTGAPGGIFLPLLVLGSISGGLFTEAISPLCGFEEHYIGNFVILGMAGYFSAIVRAPITGIILISEMTGSFNNLLALSIVSLVAYMTAELLKGVPIYDQLLDRMLEGGAAKKPRRTNKVLIESEVYLGAPVEGMSLAELNLPEGCLVVSIIRDEKEIVPGGSTTLETGDKLVILCDEYFAGELEDILDSMCRTVIQP